MPSAGSNSALPRVVAILVVNNGEAWLSAALKSLKEQDYPEIRLVGVDNGSKDGSGAILREHVPASDLLFFNRSTGFGAAVRAAVRHEAAGDADYLLLLHDDLALAPDAVRVLVKRLQSDPSLGIVGPKLREWSSEPVIQEIGMSVDRFGRAESRVERGELDQGQLDTPADVLYVSTAGMMIRAAALGDLHGFDLRFPGYHDDFDLCWRAWLLGWRVEVVPAAVGYHVAAGSRGQRRMWLDRSGQRRFLSERHTLASLLKNYGTRRLLWALPLTILLGIGKLLGFVLTRRFADAGATLRAYVWNLVHLPRTMRRRRYVQRTRRRTDGELAPLFASGLPRIRDYVDHARDWLSGSDPPTMLPDREAAAQPRGHAAVRFARERPAFVVGGVLGFLYLVSVVPLLGPGQLIGGSVLPWPESPGEFLRSYASPVAGDPLATGVTASPVQAVLGALGLASFGNEWLAQRLLVVGLVPVAWLTALRAGRLVTAGRGPRVAGATVYVLSPVVLGTLAQGRIGELVAAALFPAMLLLTARVVNPLTATRQAWRATAWLAITAAVVIAAAPGLWLVVVPVLLVGCGVALFPTGRERRRPALRMLVATVGALALLAPWLWDLLSSPGSTLGSAPASELPAWRALTLTPLTFTGLEGVGGYLAVGLTASILLLALGLGLRLRPLPVTAMFAVFVGSGALAWSAERLGVEWVWSPALLLPGAVAVAGLGVLAARTIGTALRHYALGARQLGVVVLLFPLAAGLASSALAVAAGPWDAFDRDVELVPPFVAAEVDHVGPYRVLLLDGGGDGGVRWGLTEAEGPSMLTFGAPAGSALEEALDGAVSGVLAGDLESGARLGTANVRYVVVADDGVDVAGALEAQPDLEPMVAGEGQVFLVRSWLPRAAVLPAEVADGLLESGSPGDLRAYEDRGLARSGPGTYEGSVPSEDSVLVLSEEPGLWRARADGASLPAVPAGDGVPVSAFDAGEREPGEALLLEPAGQRTRTAVLSLQLLVLLGLVSLLLRPPGLGREAPLPMPLHNGQLPLPGGVRGDHEPSLAERLDPVEITSEPRQ